MPVSTRSQILSKEDESGETTAKTEHIEKTQMRNPHHGLKEKLKSLTLLYEQQKLVSMGVKNQNFKPQEKNILPLPALDRCGSFKTEERDSNKQQLPPFVPLNQKETLPTSTTSAEKSPVTRENPIPNSTVTKTYVLTQPPNPNPSFDDAKENVAANGDRIVGFTCPRKAPVSTTVARKLSLGSQMEARRAKTGQEMDPLFERQSNGNSRIMVFVRLRPMMKKEKEAGSRSCVRIVNRRDVYLTEFASEHDYLRLKRLRGRHFTFDASFPESATQQEVYSTTYAAHLSVAFETYNVEFPEPQNLWKLCFKEEMDRFFCYGATGAGKTYTMLGTVENPGVMVLAIKDLFTKVRQRSCDGNHVVHLSYLEVYNETVRDLLSPGRPLVLREDKQGIVAAGLSQYRAYSTDEVMALLLQGNKNRTTEPTRMNETSSRSHAILQVVVEYRTRDAAMNIVNRVGKLSLIDLAGSERALATDQRTLRSIEGANINRSLLALSSCINALVEGKKHIPYRNSKLTQLLKDSLGGACNTVMIANISPSNLSFGETQNTLHWADRAKEIRNKAYETTEELVQDGVTDAEQAKLLLEVQKENRELRVQLAKQQQKILSLQAQSLAANSSPTPPPSGSSILSPPPSSNKANDKRKPKTKSAEETVRELQQVVKALEREIERMKRDHSVQIKKRDEKIRELSLKMAKYSEAEGLKMLVTRTSLRPRETTNGEVKTPGHRFLSPAPTAKKRTFWDITTANSPSVTTANGRKTRSHVNAEPVAPPSMLLQLANQCLWSVLILGPHIANYIIQPGFARQRLSPYKQ